MNKHGLFGMLLAACVGLGAMTTTTSVDAKPKKGEEKKDEPKEGTLVAAPSLQPKGLAFRMSPKKVYKVYNAAIEKDYLKKYKKVSPGIQMQRLDYEKSQYKQSFRMSYLGLKNRPSSLDGTNLTHEFTYGNGEGVMDIKRKGKKRHLFFIKKKLWNVVDVYRLGGKSKWGGDFNSAVKRMEKLLGVAGKRIEADPDNGQPYEMVQWTDGKLWLRGMNWGKKFAVSYVDMTMLQKLTALRKKNAETKKNDIDPSVKSVLRTPKDASGKPPGNKKK
jgi:hypothetical protein